MTYGANNKINIKKRLLILGASGQTGFAVLKQAAVQPDLEVTALIHTPGKSNLVAAYADHVICLDYSHEDELKQAFQSIDVCYMVLPRDDLELQHAISIIKIIAKSSVQQIIYLSGLFSFQLSL